MPFTTLPPAGAKLPASTLASLITELRPISVIKTVDTARASTIVRIADPELTIPLPANSSWIFELLLILTSAADAAGDFSGEMAWPANALEAHGQFALVDTLASGRSADLVADGDTRSSVSPSTAFTLGCSSTPTAAHLHGELVLGNTAGSLTLNWAQLASNVNATTVQDGSYLTAHRIA